MAGWPISLKDAADQLNVPVHTVGILVRTHDIPVREIGRVKGLDRAAFERLKVKARPFVRSAVTAASA